MSFFARGRVGVAHSASCGGRAPGLFLGVFLLLELGLGLLGVGVGRLLAVLDGRRLFHLLVEGQFFDRFLQTLRGFNAKLLLSEDVVKLLLQCDEALASDAREDLGRGLYPGP